MGKGKNSLEVVFVSIFFMPITVSIAIFLSVAVLFAIAIFFTIAVAVAGFLNIAGVEYKVHIVEFATGIDFFSFGNTLFVGVFCANDIQGDVGKTVEGEGIGDGAYGCGIEDDVVVGFLVLV